MSRRTITAIHLPSHTQVSLLALCRWLVSQSISPWVLCDNESPKHAFSHATRLPAENALDGLRLRAARSA